MPLHPLGRDWRQTLEEDREAILLAEKLGFEEAFIGEHVTDLAETITSCLIFIASLARDTSHIRLGSGTVNLANRHPAATAAEIAMVDTMLAGRFILGVGPGGQEMVMLNVRCLDDIDPSELKVRKFDGASL